MKGLENINAVCKNNVLELAFKRSGIKTSAKKASWPRISRSKPAGSRVDCSTGKGVSAG